MDIHINYLAIVLSVLSSMMIGYFWYGSLKFGFGKKWSTLANIDLAKSSTPLALVSAGVSAAVLAYGLAVATALVNQASGNSFLSDALMTGLFIWFCFSSTSNVPASPV